MAGTRRIDYVDGLRGVAVAMVVLHHAVNAFIRPPGTGLGPLGVSLFFVLSGFCLSYPVIRDGRLNLRLFWQRRARRILPPYYVALALYAPFAAAWSAARLGPLGAIGTAPISMQDFLAHVALIHNLVPDFSISIDGPFWSLGLEWQWYVFFPLLLAAYLRWPRWSLVGTLALAVVWAMIGHGLGGWRDFMLLPGRLFEFCCGIGCAWAVVRGRAGSAWLAAAVAAAAIAVLTLWPVELSSAVPVYFAVAGAGFAALVLAGHRSPILGRVLSLRPLLWLGGISYSLYLVHDPVVSLVEQVFLQHSPVLAQVLAVAASVAFGWCFCLLVERPAIAWSRRAGRRPADPARAEPRPEPSVA